MRHARQHSLCNQSFLEHPKTKRYRSPGQNGDVGKTPEKKHKDNDFDTDFESDIEIDLDSDLETGTNSVQGSQSLSTRKDKQGEGTRPRNAPTKEATPQSSIPTMKLWIIINKWTPMQLSNQQGIIYTLTDRYRRNQAYHFPNEWQCLKTLPKTKAKF